MRKISATFFMSLDGVVEDPASWNGAYWSDEMGAALGAGMATSDTFLYGRKTYDDMAAAWPEREAMGDDAGDDAPFATVMGDTRKVVVSHQDLTFTWRNSEQIQGDLVEGVTALKAEDGGDIAMAGSTSVVRQLLAAGLVDELNLLVHPVAVRHGERLFDETDEGEAIPLTLVSSTTLPQGVLHLVYAPA
jgi:dihydrofolate reductase